MSETWCSATRWVSPIHHFFYYFIYLLSLPVLFILFIISFIVLDQAIAECQTPHPTRGGGGGSDAKYKFVHLQSVSNFGPFNKFHSFPEDNCSDSRGPRFPYPIGVWFPVAGKNGGKRGKTGENGGKRGKTEGKRGENGEKRGKSGGGVFWTRPTHPTVAPPPPFIIMWGAFFANQIEAKALSRVRHPSPKG